MLLFGFYKVAFDVVGGRTGLVVDDGIVTENIFKKVEEL
jgi:hypothetical protein